MGEKVVKRWTQREEVVLLTRNLAKKTVEAIAQELGRSIKATEQRHYHLGLTPIWEGKRA